MCEFWLEAFEIESSTMGWATPHSGESPPASWVPEERQGGIE